MGQLQRAPLTHTITGWELVMLTLTPFSSSLAMIAGPGNYLLRFFARRGGFLGARSGSLMPTLAWFHSSTLTPWRSNLARLALK